MEHCNEVWCQIHKLLHGKVCIVEESPHLFTISYLRECDLSCNAKWYRWFTKGWILFMYWWIQFLHLENKMFCGFVQCMQYNEWNVNHRCCKNTSFVHESIDILWKKYDVSHPPNCFYASCPHLELKILVFCFFWLVTCFPCNP